MSSDPELPDPLSKIARNTLGVDSTTADPNKSFDIDPQRLKQALREAYLAGLSSVHPEESASLTAQQAEQFFWQLMDSLPDNVYFKDTRSRFTCINRAQARFLGVNEPNDAIGKSDFDYFEPENAAERFRDEQEIMQTGIGWTLHEEKDLQTDDAQKACIISCKLPLRDGRGRTVGTFGISRDISIRYLAEREVERQRNLLEAIIQILPCRIFVRDYENRFILVNEAYQAAIGARDRSEILGRRLSEFTESDLHTKIREEDRQVREEGKSILNQVEYDKSVFKKQRWVVTSKVPLRGPDATVEGIVGMTYDITEQKEAEENARALSEELADKNSQFEAELLVARQLQETLMSIGFDAERQYTLQGSSWNLEASYFYKPSHHLAGDFFDLVTVSKDTVGVLVCDVMGHGVKAALVTMLLRGLVLEMPSLLNQPDRVLHQLNNRLCSLAEGPEFPRFTTAVYLTINLETGIAKIANAGHPDPLWKVEGDNGRHSFRPCPSGSIGPALGLIPNESFESFEFSLKNVTELLLYTDGIIEQKDAMGHEFGIEKLETLLLRNESLSLSSQLKTIKSALKLTAGTDEFDDDICLVALKLSPNK